VAPARQGRYRFENLRPTRSYSACALGLPRVRRGRAGFALLVGFHQLLSARYTERVLRRGLVVAHVREIGWSNGGGWRLRLPSCVVAPLVTREVPVGRCGHVGNH
jgi:hypothetical protein